MEYKYDVVIAGGGAAGVSAAITAAKCGLRTALIEGASVFGGDLLSGLPLDGCRTTGGEWIVGGVLNELLEGCRELNGYVGSIYDRRNICVVMVNPRIMGFVILKKLAEYHVDIFPNSQVVSVATENGRVTSLKVINKLDRNEFRADVFIDCTGDGDISVMAGCSYEIGAPDGSLQPMTMIFQLRNVNPEEILEFVYEHPENCGLAENPNSEKTAKELAFELKELGFPKVFFSSNGPLMQKGIANGELTSTSMLAFNVNSVDKSIITVNTTRIVSRDCMSAGCIGGSMLEFTKQVEEAYQFIVKHVPGCQNAVLDGIAPRLGIRESRRIIGEYYLTGNEVEEGIKRKDVVCKGGHEIDVHGSLTDHYRATIRNAGSYDIPIGCLIPKGMKNMLMAGRCLSADRIAHSSARVMGTCIAMGQAAGSAAYLSIKDKVEVPNVDITELQDLLRRNGAILDGTD